MRGVRLQSRIALFTEFPVLMQDGRKKNIFRKYYMKKKKKSAAKKKKGGKKRK